MNTKALATGSLLVAALGAGFWAAMPGAAQTSPSTTQSAPRRQAAQSADEGERIFRQNCSRCHNAPEEFSSRISGTIVRHMRMRANLSRHDEQELLKYLNP